MIEVEKLPESHQAMAHALIVAQHLILDPHGLAMLNRATLATVLATMVGLSVPLMDKAGMPMPDFDPKEASHDQVLAALEGYGVILI